MKKPKPVVCIKQVFDDRVIKVSPDRAKILLRTVYWVKVA